MPTHCQESLVASTWCSQGSVDRCNEVGSKQAVSFGFHVMFWDPWSCSLCSNLANVSCPWRFGTSGLYQSLPQQKSSVAPKLWIFPTCRTLFDLESKVTKQLQSLVCKESWWQILANWPRLRKSNEHVQISLRSNTRKCLAIRRADFLTKLRGQCRFFDMSLLKLTCCRERCM